MLNAVLAILRAVVFLAGIFFGYVSAALVLSFGGSTITDFTGAFGGFGLMLAAPLCWIAAVRTGDRWTLWYLGGWLVFIGLMVLIGLTERHPIPAAHEHTGLVAVGLLAVIYLGALPLLAFRHHRRRASTESPSPPSRR